MMVDAEKVREPVTQVIEETDGARLIFELPGVPQDSIKMGVSGDLLKLNAEGNRGKFSTVQVIPFEPDPDRISVTFLQGVLEVDLRRRSESSQEESSLGKEGEEHTISLLSLEKELEGLKAEMFKILEENRSLEERVSFLQRDFQNVKRRHETEKESIADRKIMDIATGLVDVLDSFGLAKDSISSSGCDIKSIQNMVKGVEMVENQVFNLFTKVGIGVMISEGQHFDPRFHEAVGFREDPNLEDEIVAEEVSRGYLYKGNALRPAQVIVNRKPVDANKDKGPQSSGKKRSKSGSK